MNVHTVHTKLEIEHTSVGLAHTSLD